MAPMQKALDIDTTGEKVFELLTNPQPRRLTCLRSLVTCTLIALLLSGLLLVLGPSPHAWAGGEDNGDGHVYALNNDLSGPNSITVFTREEDGSLKLAGTTSIGGLGSLAAFADGTQGSLILTHDEK